MDGFVDRLHALRFLRACDPSYRALTFTLVGLPPTGYISLLLDILLGSFFPSFGRASRPTLPGSRSRRRHEIKRSKPTLFLPASLLRGGRLADVRNLSSSWIQVGIGRAFS